MNWKPYDQSRIKEFTPLPEGCAIMPTKILAEGFVYWVSDSGVCLRLVKAHESEGWFVFSDGKMYFEKRVFLIVELEGRITPKPLGRRPLPTEEFWVKMKFTGAIDKHSNELPALRCETLDENKREVWLSVTNFVDPEKVERWKKAKEELEQLEQELGL